jgi:hypothetical protein
VRVIPFLSPKAIMLLEMTDMHIDEERMISKITKEFVDHVWITNRLILVN